MTHWKNCCRRMNNEGSTNEVDLAHFGHPVRDKDSHILVRD